MSMWDDEAGYDRTDPKHPAWAGLQFDRADDDRKRVKEQPPATRAECQNDSCGCEEGACARRVTEHGAAA